MQTKKIRMNCMNLIHSTVGIYLDNCYWWTHIRNIYYALLGAYGILLYNIENILFLTRKIQKISFVQLFNVTFCMYLWLVKILSSNHLFSSI
jgi:hypothetical protein